jgi:hypothetical protein
MRKSIIAGLTVAATVMAFAGGSRAYVNDPGCVSGSPCIQHAYDDAAKGPVIELASMKDSKSTKSVRSKRKQPGQVVEAPQPQYLRIPAHPIIRDCTHVLFPQCSFRGGLNDGEFGLPY